MGLIKTFFQNSKKEQSSIKIKYLGGYPTIPGPLDTGLLVEEDYLGFMGYMGKMSYHAVFKIPLSEIVRVEIDQASKRSVGKAAAGAVLGGILLGGVGAIAGAAVGAKKQDDSIIVLTINKDNLESEVYFKAENTRSAYDSLMRMISNRGPKTG